MSYRLLTQQEKAFNRERTIQHFAYLTGIYTQYCHAMLHVKNGGRYTLLNPQEHDSFMSLIVPEVSKFCGKWFDEAMNPDTLPHPVRIAMEWHNGRRCRDAVLKSYPQYAKLLPMVHERCVKLNIGLNVPETEFAA